MRPVWYISCIDNATYLLARLFPPIAMGPYSEERSAVTERIDENLIKRASHIAWMLVSHRCIQNSNWANCHDAFTAFRPTNAYLA